MREKLAPPVEIEIISRLPDPIKYGRYLVEVHYRPPGVPDWISLADKLLAVGHAVPYPLAECHD